MKLVDHSTGQLVDVDEGTAPQALQSGKFGLPSAEPVRVVSPDGAVGTVKPEETQALIAGGGRFASDREYHQALLENKYGGLGGSLAAGGEGLARGATLGLSDPLAIGAAHLFGGKKTADEVREHLANEKEAHPWISTGAEIAGAAAPMLLSGGAAAAPEALGEAGALGAESASGVIGAIGSGVRTIGAIPRGVSAVGDLAEHAAASVLGEGSSLLGTAVRSAAKTAVRGVVEGGLFGAGEGISENALADKPLIGENLLTYVGHGALTAGLLGGAIGGVGAVAKPALEHLFGGASTKLGEAAGEQTWKWLNPLKRYSDEATARAGGTDAVGRTVFDTVLKPLVEEKGLAAAAMGTEEKLALVAKAADQTGAQIGKLVEANPDAAVPLKDMLKPIEDRIEEFSNKVGGEDKVAAMMQLKASVMKVLGAEAEGAAGAAADQVLVKRTPQELQAYLREHPETLAEMGNGPLPKHAEFKTPEGEPAIPKASEEIQVPIGKAIEQRRALQQIAYQESKALDPKLRVELLRDVTRAWGDSEVKALNAASKDAKGLAGDQLKALNRQFQHLTLAEKALETNVGRMASNNSLSLGDKIAGGAALAGGLAHGNPLAMVGAVGTSLASKAAREHGNAYAALMLDRLSTWGGVSKAAGEVTEQIDRAVDQAVTTTPKVGKPRVFKTSNTSDERFRAERDRVQQLAQVAPAVMSQHLQGRTSPIQAHAPQVAQALQQSASAATSFLASKLPPQPIPTGLTPQLHKDGYSDAQKTGFLRYVDAVEGGPPAILQRLARGQLTAEDIETMRAVYPQQYAAVSTKLRHAALQRSKPITLQKSLQISRFLGTSLVPTASPDFLQVAATSYAHHGHQQNQPSMPHSSGGRLSYSKNLMGPFERAQAGQ